MSNAEKRDPTQHILFELGFGIDWKGDEVHGSAPIVPEMHVPGTDCLRTSVLATWADTMCGWQVIDHVRPRVPVTLELDVHLYRPPTGIDVIHAVATVAKAGRNVVVPTVEFSDDDGRPVGFGTASFMVAPDPALRIPDLSGTELRIPGDVRLSKPLAERAGVVTRAPGVVALPRTDDGLNASNTVNGGLLALTVEEAALSAQPGATLESIALRYLQPVRHGPAVATASVLDGLGRVEVRDEGNENRLSVLATTRAF